MKPVYRSRLVFIPVPAGTAAGTSIPFPDQPDLKRPARVTAFETFTDEDILNTLNGATLAAADALNTVVTLSDGSDERVKVIPYASCRAAVNAGQLREVKDFELEWTQCKITATAALAGGTLALVLVHFFYPSDLK